MRITSPLLLAGLLLAPLSAAAQVAPGETMMGFTHDAGATQRYELCAADRCEAIEVTAAEGQRRFVAPAWLPVAVAVPLRIRAVWAGGTVDSPVVTFSTVPPPSPPGPPIIVVAPPGGGGAPAPDPGPAPGEPFPVPAGDHGYFDALVARPDHWRSYSLRDDAMLLPREQGGYTHSNDPTRIPRVTYDPANDPDPRRQDAAKVIVPEGGNNLRNQVRLPLETGADGFLLTWDAWYGAEWANERTAIDSQKTWQLQSGGGIWTEVRNRFRQAANNVPGALSFVDVRRYGGSSEVSGSRVADAYGDINYGSDSVGGQLANFPIYPETWVRYWVRVTPRAGTEWWDLSLWVADTDRAAVQLHRNAGIRPADEKGWELFWIEFNTSDGPAVPGRGDLVAYVRNVVLLRHPPADIAALLVAPSAPSPVGGAL